jgi:glutathione S-transferase
MDLYFSPLACSMATRIALYEIGAAASYLEVDPKSKIVLQDNSDFLPVNPLGLVPTLRTDDGVLLTENAAILQYVAERFPNSGIGPANSTERTRLQQWLCFIGTELHKGLFAPLLDKKAPAEVKSYTLERYLSRLDYLNSHLEGRESLLDHFSVADAYLGTILNWTMATPPIDLKKWPAINDYLARFKARPSVAKALAEEFELFKAEIARHKAAA